MKEKIYLCISVIIMLMLITKNYGFGQSTTASNSLTGGTPATPNEYLGSSNNYDILIKANGSERMRIDAAGLVGINATSTGARLHVAEKPDEVILLLEKQYPDPTTKDILQWKNNTVLGVIDANGRIGVGTTAPASDLHIHRIAQVGTASSYTGALKFLNSTNANAVTFQAGVSSANTTYTLPLADGSANQVLQTNGSGTLSWAAPTTTGTAWQLTGNTLTGTLPSTPNEWIGTLNTADWIIKSSGSERARVFSGGNVAIGTTTTQNKLDVYGDINSAVSTNGYKINNAYVLYHDGNTSDIYVGVDAGNATMSGHSNTAVGNLAGNAITTGDFNTAIGRQALKLNTTGYWNTACGAGALFQNIGGHSNTAVGLNALTANTSGTHNTAIGVNALDANQTSTSSTAVGFNALTAATSGFNTGIGMDALFYTTSGTNNTAVGFQAGKNVIGGGSNTFLGYQADVCVACSSYANVTAIGNGAGAAVNSSNDIELGNTSITEIWAAVTNITSSSDRRIKNNIQENVPGLSFINLLKPVTYHKDIHIQNSITGYPMKRDSAGNLTNEIDTTMWNGKYDIENVLYSGFIAQQVDSAAQQIGYDFSGIAKPKNPNRLYGLNYTEFVVPLVKAVQELSATVDSLKATPSARKAGENNDSLSQRIAQLEELIAQCCTMENAKPTGENTNSSNSGDNKQNVKLTLPEKPTLGDPQPNPNNGSTVIPYYLPENSVKAKIVFIDMLGRIMKEETLKVGYGSLYIDTQDLPSGMYSYSLVIDGKEIDNKKMIRNK